MWTKDFWKATIERALKTFAQAEVALLTASGLDLIHAPWLDSLAASGMATVISVLTSIGSGLATGSGPSLTDAEVLPSDYSPERAAAEVQ